MIDDEKRGSRYDWFISCVRLWEQDAKAALASGATGLAVVCPLMQSATLELVEQALELVLRQAPPEQQADLLSMLGIFAEPLVAPDRLVQPVGRERLMTSRFANYLLADKTAEIEARAHGGIAAGARRIDDRPLSHRAPDLTA